ncbi:MULTISPECIES: RHS repeat-associated core domain-containing protein [unclassified Streptomyces]|uniref:RHS repeat-associated core domain-containing protein n=2 Tax=Streptomyces TaxID=1883 RepID=UPI00363DBC76
MRRAAHRSAPRRRSRTSAKRAERSVPRTPGLAVDPPCSMNPPSHHALLPPALTAPAFEREKRSLTRSVFGPVSLAPKQLPQGKRRFTGPRSWPYRFAGGYQDPTGLHHFAARYYDPNTGRFTTPDPSGQEKKPERLWVRACGCATARWPPPGLSEQPPGVQRFSCRRCEGVRRPARCAWSGPRRRRRRGRR